MPALNVISLAALLALVGCAAAPAPVPESAPRIASSGLVIGTLSYQYIETGSPNAWLVHFERVDEPTKQDYTLPVAVDPQRHQGVFTGALPAGVYAFRDVSSERRHFRTAVLKMPFEVQPGEVKDAGHIAVKPLEGL